MTTTLTGERTTTGAADTPAVEANGLTKLYGRTVALDGLSMRVPRGRVFGFLGPNGAGKTTTVKVLLGLARASGGDGSLLGAPFGDRVARRSVGYLPELFRYQAWLTARDVLALHCRLAGLAASTHAAAIHDALVVVGLADRADHRVGTFSKGMQQRLGLGVALLGRPDLVILDEPTSALDPIGRLEMRGIIRDLRDAGTTVFLNSHLLGEVERVCDEVAIVNRGRVIASGSLDDLLGGETVRVRVTGLDDAVRGSDEAAPGPIDAFGAPTWDGEWLTVRGCPQDRVPDLVEALVARGGRVYAVEPARESLEDRFVDLLTAARADE